MDELEDYIEYSITRYKSKLDLCRMMLNNPNITTEHKVIWYGESLMTEGFIKDLEYVLHRLQMVNE